MSDDSFIESPVTVDSRCPQKIVAWRPMRELAALSFDPDSLDRDLEDEINRNAWGIREA